MGLIFLVVAKVLGFCEGQQSLTGWVSKVMLEEITGAKNVQFNETQKVAEAALEFLPLLGAKKQIEPRPSIFLTHAEEEDAKKRWHFQSENLTKLLSLQEVGSTRNAGGTKTTKS